MLQKMFESVQRNELQTGNKYLPYHLPACYHNCDQIQVVRTQGCFSLGRHRVFNTLGLPQDNYGFAVKVQKVLLKPGCVKFKAGVRESRNHSNFCLCHADWSENKGSGIIDSHASDPWTQVFYALRLQC